MRRSLKSLLAAALGFTVACGSDLIVGTRSDGVTVYCNEGEYYYECTPDHPDLGTGGDTQGGGEDDGDGGGDLDPDGDGSGTGGDGGGGSGGDDGGGDGTTCGPDTYPCTDDDGDGGGGGGGGGTDGGDACEPWPVGTATMLWPPNHKLHTYTLADCAKVDVCPNGDAIAAGTVTKITADEAVEVNKGGDGHTTNYDMRIIDATHFELRSERQGGADGRVYTVYYLDADGNEGSCQFIVPHNRGPHEGGIDSGTVVTVTR